jgi:BirA family transcriptional regulator, biotin operon repressor / biotin---[acetyl-CoA-carboxylase] ligase
MENLLIDNPFPGASSFLIGSTTSTMDEARRLAERGFPAGSLVAAEEQTGGRGRIPGRRWEAEAGRNLLFTVLLDPATAMPGGRPLPGLPLRVGLALEAAVSDYASSRGHRFPRPPRIKWPNDLLLGDRKAAGILCEAGPRGILAGVGLNCNQKAFGPELGATSLALELGREISRWNLLELFLGFLGRALEDPNWREAVAKRLWRLGEMVSFLPGAAGGGGRPPLAARLEGIDEEGSLLLRPEGGKAAEAYPAGELTGIR